MARVLARRRRALVDHQGPASEPFRTLRLAVELGPKERRGNAIVFTSPHLGDGKSTVAANYALIASTQGRVLLIDGDLRSPSLHEFFEVPRAPGLLELLRDGLEVSDVAHSLPDFGSLQLVTAGAPVTRTADLLTSRPMRRLLDRASAAWDAVVIDSPPILAGADASGLSAHPSTDVIVVASAKGKRRPLLRAKRELELIDANVLGLVLNRKGRLSSYAYY